MSEECGNCEYSDNLKGCAAKHATTVRKLLSEEKTKEADENLAKFESHLEDS